MSNVKGDPANCADNFDSTRAGEGQISVLDLLIVLAKHKWIILGATTVASVTAAIVALLMPNIYTATARIVPPQQNQASTAGIIGQLGALSGNAMGIRNPNDLYVGMLKSRTVADGIISRFDLQSVYGKVALSGARGLLQRRTAIESGKDSIISIEVDDTDPARAASLANAYVDQLYKLTQSLAVTEASQRRLFFERQLAQAKNNLTSAEIAVRNALQRGGVVRVDEQSRAIIETTARLRAQISLQEVQIGAMRSFATPENPSFERAQHEVGAMKRELARLEGTNKTRDATTHDGGTGLANVALLRDLKYHELIYEMLAKQFELAKIDEAKDSSLVQVLDFAIAPETKNKPKRLEIVVLATLAAIFLSVIMVFFREAMLRARADPEQSKRLHTFRAYLWTR